MRNIFFENGEYYHIYNRGVDKREIFIDEKDYWKFFNDLRDFNNPTSYEERLNALGFYDRNNFPQELTSSNFKDLGLFLAQQEKIVDIVSYSINPNHFHLDIKQLKDKGISNFMHKVGLSYTQYFNKKYGRSGVLLQGAFKAIHIDSDEYFLKLVAYINGNIEIHGLGDAKNYKWSSYQAIKKELNHFLKNEPSDLSNLSVLSGLEIILSQFPNVEQFERFVQEVIVESKENKKTKKEFTKYLLE